MPSTSCGCKPVSQRPSNMSMVSRFILIPVHRKTHRFRLSLKRYLRASKHLLDISMCKYEGLTNQSHPKPPHLSFLRNTQTRTKQENDQNNLRRFRISRFPLLEATQTEGGDGFVRIIHFEVCQSPGYN